MRTLGGVSLSPNIFRWFVEAGLVAAIAWLLYGWFVHQGSPQPVQSEMVAEPLHVGLDVHVQALIDSALFGRGQRTPDLRREQPVKVLPTKRRDIKLTGTVVAGKQSVALISVGSGKKPGVFHLGDTITPGVILKSVEKLRIVIEAGGRLEVVNLEKTKSSVGSPMPVSAVPRSLIQRPAVQRPGYRMHDRDPRHGVKP